MAVDKCIRFHVWAKLCVYIKTARKHCYKQIGRSRFTCNLIVNIDGCTCPIYLHFVTGFMLDTHCSLSNTSPLTIVIIELCAHVRLFAGCTGFQTVFCPEKCKGNSFLGKFPMDLRIIRHKSFLIILISSRIKQTFQRLISDIVI